MINSILHTKRLGSIAVSTLFIGVLAACQSTSTPISVIAPTQNEAALELLTTEQLAFIKDAKQLSWFNLTAEKVMIQLAQKDPQAAKVYVTALMDAASAAKFQTDQDKVDPVKNGILEPLSNIADTGIIPLNTEAGSYNKAKVLQPALLDEFKRTPGPFSVQRYIHEDDGILTFANAPVAVRAEDLKAGKVEVAFVGIPLALGSGWRDSKNAPTVLRGMYGLGGYDISGGVNPALVLSMADYGNIYVDNMSPELSIDHVREQIGDMVDAGVVPFIIGGDHTLMYPTVAAMNDKYGADSISVVHMDAHYGGERGLEHTFSDKQSVSRLLEDGLLKGSNLVQVGLRGPSQNKEALTWLQSQGVRYHTMAQVEAQGWDKVMNSVITEAKTAAPKTFISFDMSVIDPAFVEGAGKPIPGGLTMREVLTTVRRVCAETEIIGFEMLDIAPYLDVSYKTALSANYIMHACLTGIAMRKEGITQTQYLDPLSVSHGQK